jgi:hypothetical protein
MDVNGDGKTTGVQDAIALLTKNFIGGVTIPPPHPMCGELVSDKDTLLGCEDPITTCP